MNSRPPLTEATTAVDFKDFYWLKRELIEFCRLSGLSTTGSKMEIAARIEEFLTTRTKTKPIQKQKKSFICSAQMRKQLLNLCGSHFRFTVKLQRWIRENPQATLEDIAECWHTQRHENAQEPIAKQFEYNAFAREFFKDPVNQSKSHGDFLEAWKLKKSLRKSSL